MRKKNIEKVLGEIRTVEIVLPEKERRKLKIKDAGKESVIVLKGEPFKVTCKNRYEVGSYEWFELKLYSLSDGREIFLEWEYDDKLELAIYDRATTLKELGIDKRALMEYDDEEEGEFIFEGKKFFYEDSDQAYFYEDMAGEKKSLYYWDFEDDDEEIFISIEQWDGKYEVAIGYEVTEFDIDILSKGME